MQLIQRLITSETVVLTGYRGYAVDQIDDDE